MQTSTTEVVTLMGGKRVFKRQISERHEMREVLRQGLPYGVLESLAKAMGDHISKLTKVIGLAPRTLARCKESGSTFSPVESDRLYRLARIASLAVEVLGSREKAKKWLSRPNRALECPLTVSSSLSLVPSSFSPA